MIRIVCQLMAIIMLLASCRKSAGDVPGKDPAEPTGSAFVTYTIAKGAHYCDKNFFRELDTTQLHFSVLFDSSAVYTTADPANQEDINKLYGFADNNSVHHQFSARFGWRWSAGALRLFAYIYNNAAVESKELATIAIGKEVDCRIRAEGSRYIFSVNGQADTLLRKSNTQKAKGYQLYPYFGGDEAAPHNIRIRLKDLP